MRFFGISRIIKVEVGVIKQSRRLKLITLTEALIILDITKKESYNKIIIYKCALRQSLYLCFSGTSCIVTSLMKVIKIPKTWQR